MKAIIVKTLGACLIAMVTSAGAASAKPLATTDVGDTAPVVPIPRAQLLADSVVVTPQGAPAPAAAPAPAPAVQPVTVQPVEAAPRRTTVVQESTPHNYMSTIAVSALMGAVAGVLIGGSIYYLGNREDPVRIGYWAAGGVLVGTGVGIAQIMVQESRADAAVTTRFPTDPAPTYRLALANIRF